MSVELIRQGKVRDVYTDGKDIILVASDRVSVYDVVLPTPIRDKGAILTQLSLWWFDQFSDLVPNHVISQDVPEQWQGRAIRCTRLDVLPIECVVRGYITGSGMKSYQATGKVSGIELPGGLVEADRLPEPIFTPTTKVDEGHDAEITFDQVAETVGHDTATRLRDLTVEIYRRGSQIALERGLIIADTKLEFGYDASGALTLADEVFTPDSSRFWKAANYHPGGPQASFDKQIVRDWSATLTTWDRTYPGPGIPTDVVTQARNRYIEIYETLTGQAWTS